MELINNLPNSRLTKQKMMTIDDIVHSALFFKPDCRSVLLSQILHLVKQLLESSNEVYIIPVLINTYLPTYVCMQQLLPKKLKS